MLVWGLTRILAITFLQIVAYIRVPTARPQPKADAKSQELTLVTCVPRHKVTNCVTRRADSEIGFAEQRNSCS